MKVLQHHDFFLYAAGPLKNSHGVGIHQVLKLQERHEKCYMTLMDIVAYPTDSIKIHLFNYGMRYNPVSHKVFSICNE